MKSICVTRTGYLCSQLSAICGILFLTMASSATAAAQVTAVPPYTVSVFATSVPHVYFQPDSITVWNGHLFVGYGNNAKPDGSSGFSTIVEYTMDGTVLHKMNPGPQRWIEGRSENKPVVGDAKRRRASESAYHRSAQLELEEIYIRKAGPRRRLR